MEPNPYRTRVVAEHAVNTTQRKICHRYLQLYATSDTGDMSITELCRAVPVARTTFYHYFASLDEVRHYIEDNWVGRALRLADQLGRSTAGVSSKTFVEEQVADFLAGTRLTLKVLMLIHPSRTFLKKISDALKARYWERCGGDEMRLEIISGGICALINNYLRLKQPVDHRRWVARSGKLTQQLLVTMSVNS